MTKVFAALSKPSQRRASVTSVRRATGTAARNCVRHVEHGLSVATMTATPSRAMRASSAQGER